MLGYNSEIYKSVYFDESASLDESGFLKRKIEGTEYFDLVNFYPFCMSYKESFGNFDTKAITTTIVTNPLDLDFKYIMCKEPYKEHAVVDLENYDLKNLPENHRRNIKKNNVEVSIKADSKDLSFHMYNVYQNLIKKHNIIGTTAYSLDQIQKLLNVPGTTLVMGSKDNYYVNYCLFYITGDDVYYHIGCQSDTGYQLNSNFQVMHEALLFFKNLGLKRVLLGASPDGSSGEGLRRFKQGFATEILPNYIIKLIHNQEVYDKLSEGKSGSFFPLYRS